MPAEREQANGQRFGSLCDFSPAFALSDPRQSQGRGRGGSIQDWGFAR